MKSYLVGGAVRDQLLGLTVKDRDWVVVGATPADLIDKGYKQVGADFPVFLHPSSKEEYALARTERKSGTGYTGFEVEFDASVTLEQDLERRDLTINAIALADNGNYIDPFNGRADLEQRVLRHVSGAFREDPLRVLRIARFAARFAHLGFTIAPETHSLLKEMARSGELESLVAERVWSEMSRALLAQSPSEFFFTLRRISALKVIFPELDALFGVPQPMRWHPEVDTGIHVLKALDHARQNSADVDTLMAVLCHDLGKGMTPKEKWPSHHGHEALGANILKKLGKRYKWPRSVIQLSEQVARFHTHCHKLKELRSSTILKTLSSVNAFRNPDQLAKFTLACRSDFNGRSGFEKRHYPQEIRLKACLDACNKIDNNAFKQLGLQGKEIGEAIDRARIKAIEEVMREYRD